MAGPVPPIQLDAELAVPVGAAWRNLTEPDAVARWFAAVSPLGGPGDPYAIDFGDGSVVLGVIRDVEPGREFSHTWRWAEDDESATTLVTWSAEAVGPGRSRVRLRHEGWGGQGLEQDRRDDHAGYWAEYLAALEALVTAGD